MSAGENPQAFPHGNPTHGGDVGMSLRDWFAGQALAGMAAFHGTYGMGNGPGEVALRAYEIADAMLLARKGCEA